jgi:hypothetical protein
MTKKRKILTPEERTEMRLQFKLSEIKEKLNWGMIPKNPTRWFNVGDRVHWGAHQETYVREIYEDGLYYKVESIGVQRNSFDTPSNEFHLLSWIDVFQYNISKPTNFTKKETYFLRLLNTSLESLLYKVYDAGVDFDVEYQREHVWELDDKIALIDSIFNNVDIGKFVFVRRDMGYEGKLYEIIDGKQRLTAICEFYEGRFQYNGFYYSQLSDDDKGKFKNHGITYGYLENPDKRAIFETFIKLNTCGKPMANKHIDKVKKLLNELED